VTDFQLQWGDGLALLRAVKGRFPHRPVIMFTATGTQEVAVEAMKSGLDDYIIKAPKHYVRLLSSVRAVLQRSEAERRASDLQMRLDHRVGLGAYRVCHGCHPQRGCAPLEAHLHCFSLYLVVAFSPLPLVRPD
jgi:DNA-binding response OmpR family regulator